ncbi:MAG TPA: sugar phosphate nucleotidyltransferase [Candidatus Sulfomarinibacteraceae bacterium]|nr:sugar phosphate nucleotidyltransferase [Candidatus Sulfomarinibacteraceae bacterium]
MYVVILAGGGGTRLWPLSRPETPKPFLPLLDDRSLLQRTLDRVVEHPADLPDLTAADITVVTDRRYWTLVRAQCPGVRVIAEPVGRNTAAAIALAAILIERPDDEVMAVLPADHHIDPEREAVFRSVLDGASRLAEGSFGIDDPLVTLGVDVDRPATEYGYLLPDVAAGLTEHGLAAYPLAGFEEKPAAERAAILRHKPGVAWNAGIFLWRRRSIRAALDRHTSLETLLAPVAHSESGLAAAYDQLRPDSIDHAVMEGAARAGRVVMASMSVGWSDLGSWTALLGAIGATGTGEVIQAGNRGEAGPDDLVVERVGGRLTVSDGPRGILGTTPTALLRAAAPGRTAVEALVDRVTRWEDRS